MTRAQAEHQIDQEQGRLLWCANLQDQPITWYSLDGDCKVVPLNMRVELSLIVQRIRDLRARYVYPGFGKRRE